MQTRKTLRHRATRARTRKEEWDAMLSYFQRHFTIGDVVTACSQLIAESKEGDPQRVLECRQMIDNRARYDDKPPSVAALVVLLHLDERLTGLI